jgi:class 3 adenylate cyclase
MQGGKSSWQPAQLLAAYAGAMGLLCAGLGYAAWSSLMVPAPGPDATAEVVAAAAASASLADAWPGAAIGFAVGAALAWALGRVLLGISALKSLAEARDACLQAGLALPKETAISPFRPALAEQALADMVRQAAHQALAARKDKDKFQGALATYADPTLSTRLKESSSVQAVGTQKVRCAILFCDIRGFTKMSETLKVEEVVYVLNDYFAVGSQAVTANGGQINKFIGDAILAVFQDPPGHVTGQQACRNAAAAALELVNVFRRQRNVWQDKIKTPFETDLGVGVHYGELIMGNFGSPQRMEYTVIGDTVNFASRLCSLAAKGQVKLSDEAWAQVSGHFEADRMEPVAVKGKAGLHQTWLLTTKKPGI